MGAMTAKISVLLLASIALLAASSLTAAADDLGGMDPPSGEDDGWLIAPSPGNGNDTVLARGDNDTTLLGEGNDTTPILEDGDWVISPGSDENLIAPLGDLVDGTAAASKGYDTSPEGGLLMVGVIGACAALAIAIIVVSRKTGD